MKDAELRKLPTTKMANEKLRQTLQAKALVHEMYAGRLRSITLRQQFCDGNRFDQFTWLIQMVVNDRLRMYAKAMIDRR